MAIEITVGSGVPEDQLPPGNYPATLTAVTEKTIEYQGESREVYEWAFAVEALDEDGNPADPIAVTGLSSRMTGPKSKTAAYLVALLGPAAVAPGATFTMNDLVGKKCLVQTDLNNAGYHRVIGAFALPAAPTPRRQTNRVAAGAVPPAAPAAAPEAPPVEDEAAVPASTEAEEELPF